MTINFHRGFDAPWNDSTIPDVVAEGAYPYSISLDNRAYVIDLSLYKRNTLAQFRQVQDVSREPGEQSLSVEGVWKRTGSSSFSGAGQQFYDDDDSDRNRFWHSRGIDCWERRQVKLLHGTTLVRASSSVTQFCEKVGFWFVFCDGTTVQATQTPIAGTGWVDQLLGASGVSSMVSDGTKLYCACGPAGVRTVTPGSPGGTQLVSGGTFAAEHLVYANGWLLGLRANEVKVIAANGTVSPLYTQDFAGFRFNSGAASPLGIYLAGNNGDRGSIYRTTVNDSGSALQTPVFAGDVPAGETINAISYYSGVVLIGTSVGLRIATVRSDGGLDVGAVIVDESGVGCHCFESRGQYVWFGSVNGFDSDYRGLSRADLARFTEVNVPAYAPDLASSVASGRTTSVATWPEVAHEHRLFCVSGSGLWAESQDKVAEGVIDYGYLGQGSPEPKTLQSVSVAHEALRGTITVEVSNESGNAVEAEVATQGTYRSEEIARSIAGERLQLQIALGRDGLDPTEGPALHRWTVRVVPAPAAVEEIFVPILMADVVRDNEINVDLPFDPYAEFFRFKQLESNREVVTYREGQASYQVTIRDVRLEGAVDWSNERRFFDATITLRLVTVEGVPPQLGGL